MSGILSKLNKLTDSLNIHTYWVAIPSIILGLFVSSLVVYPGTQEYKELTAGAITWIDQAKAQDYFSITAFLLSTLLVMGLLNNTVKKLIFSEKSIDKKLYADVRDALLLSSMPLLFYVINAWPYKTLLNNIWLILSAVFVIASVLPLIRWRGCDTQLLSKCYRGIVASTSISVVTSVLSASGFYLAGLRYKAYLDYDIPLGSIKLLSVSIACISLIIFFAMYLFSKDIEVALNRMKQHSIIAQLGVPLLFLVLIPAPWRDAGIDTHSLIPSHELIYFVGALILIGLVQLAYRYKNITISKAAMSSLAIAAVFVVVKMPFLGVPDLSPDDYHLGEVYLPWMQYEQFGQIFYSGYDPARGLNEALAGYLGGLFFDGSAAAINYASLYIGSFLIIAFVVVACWSIGALFALVAITLIPFPIHLILELLIVLMLMFDKRIISKPYMWMSLYVFLSVSMVLYRPQTAPALVIGLSVIFFYIMGKLYKAKTLGNMLIFLVLVSISSQIVNIYIPLNDMIFGVMRYVLDHSEVNNVAHSSMMSSVHNTDAPFVLHMMRFVFLLCLLASTVLLIKVLKNRGRDTHLDLIVAGVTLFLLILMPYVYGRVVGLGVTRGPIYSVYFMAILVPFVIYKYSGNRYSIGMISTVVIVTSALFPQSEMVSGDFVKHIKLETAVNQSKLVVGELMGVHNYGTGYGRHEHLANVAILKKVMDLLLGPNETYLDLTNRNALYFYLERKVPLTSGAIYNLPSRKMQEDGLNKLRSLDVPVVLAGSRSQRFDGGSPSVRTGLIYSYVLDNYFPVIVEDNIVLFLARERYEKLTGENVDEFDWSKRVNQYKLSMMDGKALLISSSNTEKSNIDVAAEIFHQKYLKKLPISWGRSVESLTENGAINVVGPVANSLDLAVGKKVDLLSISNAFKVARKNRKTRPDLLEIELQCKDGVLNGGMYIIAQTMIKDSVYDVPYNVELADAVTARLLIPMDVSPVWLLSDDIVALNIHAIRQCNKLGASPIRVGRPNIPGLLDTDLSRPDGSKSRCGIAFYF